MGNVTEITLGCIGNEAGNEAAESFYDKHLQKYRFVKRSCDVGPVQDWLVREDTAFT